MQCYNHSSAKHLAQSHTRRVDIVAHIIHRNAHRHCNVGIAVACSIYLR